MKLLKMELKKLAVIQNEKRSERFEVAFNRIHAWLQRISRNATTDKYSELLRINYSRHSIIRKYYHDLKMYGRLRNSLVHDKIALDYYIAEPHEKVVEKIERIASQVSDPKNALDIATRPVFYFKEDTSLVDVLKIIQKRAYSQFPVYDENGFKWLLTSNCIAQWLAGNLLEESRMIEDVKIRDLEYLHSKRFVEFAAKNSDIFSIEDVFEKYHLENKKLEAVLITENGKASERPIGIITPWDLVEIDVLE
ncbi:CBS domain-containing protein [Mesobacillus sp. LC4]